MANIRLNKLEIGEVTLTKLDDVLSAATDKELKKYEGNCILRGQSVYEEFDALSYVDFEVTDTDRGPVRKMRIYNAKHIFETIPPFLTTLRKFQWS